MTMTRFMTILVFAFTGITTYSQVNKPLTGDTSISFKVFGACTQCKTRIEESVKIKGVENADWNVDTKLLKLTYDPSQTSLDKIQNRIR